jgi:hypothetical protein
MHEELYQGQISKLQSLGLSAFIGINPDLLSHTGAIHRELAPVFEEIDRAIQEGPSISELRDGCIQEFKQESCAKQLGKITAASMSLCAMSLASFIILENIILIKDTPVTDMFYGNKTQQTNESMDITQIGGLFSSITAFGVAVYAAYQLFVKTPYKKIIAQKVNDCFARQNLEEMSMDMRNELHRIKEIKLKN